MEKLISEIRMYLAEKLLFWATDLADEKRTDGILLKIKVYEYIIELRKLCKK